MIDGSKDLDGYDMDQGLNNDYQGEEAVPIPGSEADVDPTQETAEQEAENAKEAARQALEKASEMMEQHGGMMLLVFLSGAVLLLEAAVACVSEDSCTDNYGFAVAAGFIALVVTAAFLFLQRSNNLSGKVRLGLVIGLFVWWVIIAYFTTFQGPFSTPGNGYFAAWAGLFGMLKVLSHDVSRVRETVDKLAHLGFKMGILMIGSVVVLLAGWGKCTGEGCGGPATFAMVAGGISFFVGLVLLFASAKLSPQIRKYVLMFLAVWWLVAFIFLTFVNPFRTVGNGYFATVGCTAAALLMYGSA